jgi:MarR family transcriptional regulator, organic hydroperoxide resistance regulator
MAKPTRPATSPGEPLTVSRPQLLIRGSDHAFRQFVHDTLAFAARIQSIRNALGGVIGLSGTQYTILIAIAREQPKTGIGINHVAEQLHFSPAFVTIEVNKLVAAKLITKKENPKDRRRVLLAVTPKAEETLRNLTVVQRPVNDTLFDSLDSDDFARLRARMPDLVDSADRALELCNFMSKNESGKSPAGARSRRVKY